MLRNRSAALGGLYTLMLGSILALWSSASCSPQRIPPPRIILITLDTTRADHLGVYGYHRNTSPNLDALAAESILYTEAIATSNWTLPSHASLFTGKFASSHGAHYDPEGPLRLMDAIEGEPSWDRYRVRGLARGELTLARLLGENGYTTGAVVAGPWMKRVFGLDEGFDFYDQDQISTVVGRRAEQVTDRAIEWLQSVKEQRFFLFLNYYDPHLPYTPPEEFAGAFLSDGKEREGVPPEVQEMRGQYDAEVLYMDHHIGRLLDQLRRWEIYSDSWIIVTADHGEALGEHDTLGHGFHLFQEEVHIPLFMKYPAGEEPAGRSSQRIQLTDILPLVCLRVGIPVPAGIQGSAPKIDHPIVAETYPLEGLEGREGHWRAIFDGDYKFLWNSLGQHKLFNLRDDPEEILNLAPDVPDRAETMGARLDAYLASLPGPPRGASAGEIDEETRKALENLGYLD